MCQTLPHPHRLCVMLSWLICAWLLPSASAQTLLRSQDYIRDVISLSETLGKAHAVRLTCNGRNDQYWRDYMQRLLELEAPYQGSLRRSMVNGFNAGFSVAQNTYDICDGRTVEAEQAFARSGKALADALVKANMPARHGLTDAGDEQD